MRRPGQALKPRKRQAASPPALRGTGRTRDATTPQPRGALLVPPLRVVVADYLKRKRALPK